MEVKDIFLILLFLCASALCIALIFYIKKITSSVKDMELSVKELSDKIQPLISSITDLSEKLNFVAEEAKEPVAEAKDLINQVKERIDLLLSFEERIRNFLINRVEGIINAGKSFFDSYKHNGRHQARIKEIHDVRR